MCGITGFVGAGEEADLRAMLAPLRHRGPDDAGTFWQPGVGLGHARLSILDLSPAGHQPMWNHDRSVVVVFNGEIYDYLESRRRLQDEGRVFRGGSDTEVLLALYDRDGEACFESLSGMFALALYDVPKRKLILARDRLGKKPLYWAEMNGTLMFASEPKALAHHPRWRNALDVDALNAYLALDYVPTPMSIFAGVHKLEPGTILIRTDTGSERRRFWHPRGDQRTLREGDALRELDGLVARATASRLVSDVPLGIFLSGGLDSSTVAYYAVLAQRERGEPVHTFSIGFEEASFDESRYARDVAAHLGTRHHHRLVRAEDSLAAIPEIMDRLDEPLADASIIPTYLLSRFARESVTVALGGDGGDELFAGYPTFQAERALAVYRACPAILRRGVLEPLVSALPTTHDNFSLKFKLQTFIASASEPDIARRHMRWLGTFGDAEREQLLEPDVGRRAVGEGPYAQADRHLRDAGTDDEHNGLLWVYMRSYMMDQVLVKVDRASMYRSLEVRAPFLDHTVVEFAHRLPYRLKLRGLTSKYLLKRLMEGRLPRHVIHRPKKGFGVPVGAWLRGPLREWAESLLSETNLRAGGLFVPARVRALWREHLDGARDHRKQLWNLLVFLEWQRRYGTPWRAGAAAAGSDAGAPHPLAS